jgi:MFS family permease
VVEVASPQTVMRTYLAVVGLFNVAASLIWGVNTLFLLAAGLTLTESFVANAFFTLGMVIFEIPTGVVADTLGRRFSFLASLVVLSAGTLAYVWLYWMHAGIVPFAIASVFLGLGFTFYSGAVEAWVVDAMAAVNSTMPLEAVFARGGQVQGAAMLIGTLGGGVIAHFDLAVPYVVRTVALAACFVVAALWMRDLGFERRTFRMRQVPREMRTVARTSLADGWHRAGVRWLLLSGMVYWTFLIWGWYAWQPHFVDLFGGAVWITGVVAAGASLMMILGNSLAPRLAARVRDRAALLAFCTVVFAAGLLGVAAADSFWPAVLAFLVAMAAFGIHEPVRMAMVHALIPSRTRATVISFGGLMGSAGGVVSQILLADFAETNGIPAGYAIGAAWALLAIPLILLAARAEPTAAHPPRHDAEPVPSAV